MRPPQVGFAQAPQSPGYETESVQDLLNHLTPEQKQLFEQATKAFNAQRYSEALAVYKQMLTQLQRDPVISKFASEAALNTGDISFAMTVLKPLAAADPSDWQAAALLTRACAESGDRTCRDSGMAHMIDLHQRAITPPGMQQ
ncbi:MAG: tetratricopeptide repeat protein [Bryobacteraceae bacterium]